MELYHTIFDWLNHEPAKGPSMQLEGCYGMMGWRDLQANAAAERMMTLRHMMLMVVLAIVIPVVLLV